MTLYYPGKTVADLKADTLSKLRQPALNYDRYTEANILRALNAGLMEGVRRIRNLQSFAIIQLSAGYAQYAPPSQMISPRAAFFYQNSNSYWELTQKTRAWLDSNLPGWRITDGDPTHMFPGDSIGGMTKLGFYPKPDTAGSVYSSSPDTGVVVTATGMTTSGNIDGTNSAAHATICTDSAGRTIEDLGVQVGMMAFNVTDGSKGQISAVSGSTFSATLTGGTANTWGLSQNFRILAGEYGVVTGVSADDEEYIFSADLGELVSIGALTGNVYLEFYRRPLKLAYDTQYPEFPPDLQACISDYAVWDLKRSSVKGSTDDQEAMAAIQAFNAIISGYRSIEEEISTSTIRFNW
jgi:hypothetical protein